MRSAIIRYSPHHITWCLGAEHAYLLTSTSLQYGAWRNTGMLTTMFLSYMNHWEAFKEVQEQSTAEVERQKWYYDRKANATLLEPGDLVLAKADDYKGKSKMKDHWEEELYKVICQFAEDIPLYLMKNEWIGSSQVLHQNWLFLIDPMEATPLCTVIWAEQARCPATTLENQTSDRSETEKVPQSVDYLLPVQQQTAETPLGWVCGCQCWDSCGRGTDHTGKAFRIWLATINSTPPLFILEIASS